MLSRFNMRRIAQALAIAVLCTFMVAGAAIAKSTPSTSQPHMQAALNYLHQALAELNAATSDKAGHRNQAINAVQTAINQTKAGMNASP